MAHLRFMHLKKKVRKLLFWTIFLPWLCLSFNCEQTDAIKMRLKPSETKDAGPSLPTPGLIADGTGPSSPPEGEEPPQPPN